MLLSFFQNKEIGLKLDLKTNRMGLYGLDSPSSRQGSVAGSCEHGNEPTDSIKCWEIVK
jgi:hypothetical protein